MGYRDALNDVVDGDFVANTITVGTTEVLACASGTNLPNRQELNIFNPTLNTIWYGVTGLTASNIGKGIPIGPGEVVSLQYGPNVSVYLIAAQAGNTITIHELS